MRGKNDHLLKLNQTVTSSAVFMESYNKSIPADFPRASAKSLKHFQAMHPGLFKNGNEWSIDKHRKKLMDWLPAYVEGAGLPRHKSEGWLSG